MFAAEAKAIIKNMGAQKTLISNSNLNEKMELLTLVKVREGTFWTCPKYRKVMCTLPDLMEGEEFSPEVKEEVIVQDFMTHAETKGTGSLGGGDGAVGEAKVSGKADNVDGQEKPVSIKKKETNLKTVRSNISGRKIQKEVVKRLKLKEKDKLAFVYETVYNTGPVRLIRKSSVDGSISASCQKMVNLLFDGSKKEETTFTIPEESTFAYGLVEIMLEDEQMEISYEPWTHKQSLFGTDSSGSEKLQEVREGIQMKEPLLKPLKDLPESTRRDLLRNLKAVLEDGDALGLLEETLDESSEGASECPQSQAVSSFMKLLNESNVSTAVKDALHLLVSAMDTLPGGMQQPLTSCSPEPLRVLSQMVDDLKEVGEVKVPESLPAPLQKDGELRWGVELICSTDEELAELSDMWDRPPEVLLEVLSLTILGLNMLHPTN